MIISIFVIESYGNMSNQNTMLANALMLRIIMLPQGMSRSLIIPSSPSKKKKKSKEKGEKVYILLVLFPALEGMKPQRD